MSEDFRFLIPVGEESFLIRNMVQQQQKRNPKYLYWAVLCFFLDKFTVLLEIFELLYNSILRWQTQKST